MASTEFDTGSHKSRGAGFLFFLGSALVVVGVGFAFAPHYSWQVTRIVHQASEFGVQIGSLVVGGLVLFGLGIVARTASASSPSTHDTSAENEALQSELRLLNEQLSNKLAQLRMSLLQINEGVTTLSAQQQAHLQNDSQRSGGTDHSQDAVFRLAASLDKLHAHFDERVHAVDLQLRSGFESLLNVSHDLRRVLEHHAPVSSTPSHGGQAQHGHPQDQGPEGTIDFFETMQKLDAIAGESESLGDSLPRRQQPQAPFPSQGGAEALDALLPEEYRDRY